MATIKVLVADDNEEMRADIQDELAREFVVVGGVGSGDEAINATVRLDPDVLVLDITLPGMNGLQVASRLQTLHSRTKILFLTIQEQPEYVAAAFKTGASGYVTKRHLAADLAVAIRQVYGGKTFLSPSLRE